MAQFDIYKNSNTRTKKQFTYLVDIQSEVITDLGTRIVMPLKGARFFVSRKKT
jgi:toxin CcdB